MDVIDLDAEANGEGSHPLLGKLTIDLVQLQDLASPEADVLRRYLGMIQVQRGDFNGRVLSIRRDDHRAVACVLETPLEAIAARLAELGVVVEASSTL